jgi:capsular polysaccharide biosynthesis protein
MQQSPGAVARDINSRNNGNMDNKLLKEIDVIEISKKVLREYKLLAGFIVVFAIMGVVYALNIQKTYTANVILAPEATSMGMSSSLSDIAGMVGLNVGKNGSSVDAIYPEIYPDVFASTDFILKLFDIPVTPKDGGAAKPYFLHLAQDAKIPFWQYPRIWLMKLIKPRPVGGKIEEINPAKLTQDQSDIVDAIRACIGCQLNKSTNIITIKASDIDPCIAAALADTLQSRLQEYITLYRTQKARNDLEYAKKLNEESKRDYLKAAHEYSAFSDANRDLLLMSYQSKQEYLENEMQLKYNMYTQTASQVQQAYAKVQENTPAFTILQRATVPLKASSTPRYMMVLGFLVAGVACDALWVLLVRDLLKKLRKRKNS